MATPEQIQAAIDGLRAANVVHVYSAARAAGLSFRNGPSKYEVITLLQRNPSMLCAAWANVQRQAGQAPSEPDTQGTAQAPSAPMAAPTQPEHAAPSNYKAPAPSAPSADPAGLVAALRAAIGATPIDADQVRTIAAEVTHEALQQFEVDASGLDTQIRAMVADAVAKLPQGTVINLPELPEPIKLADRQHFQFPELLSALRCGLNVYIVGGAGTGKTQAAEAAAEALGRKLYVQGPATYAHEILGFMDSKGAYVRSAFREAFEHGGVFLQDELDACSAEVGLVENAGLANGLCAFPDGLVKKHPDFLAIGAANTDGSGATMQFSGRARLDGAFLDRFVQIDWEIDPAIELTMAQGCNEWLAAVRAVRTFMADKMIADVGATPRAVAYGAKLIRAGWKPAKVLSACLKRGALREDWAAVERLPAVAEFLTGF